MNANSGENQKDYFLVDGEGNLLNDIQWDFETITSIIIYPIPNEKMNIGNGNFITNSLKSQSETNYTRSNSGKSIYFLRDIAFSKCANLNVYKITHILSEDVLSGSYIGFLRITTGADVNLSDMELYSRKYSLSGRSTYDLNITGIVNLNCENIVSNDILDTSRWGILGTNYTKDVVFKNCVLNRIDAHQGIYNLSAYDCEIGSRGFVLIGQGDLHIVNTNVIAETFISLRDDYGSTWNGNVYIDNCTYTYKGTYSPKLFSYSFSYDDDGSLHDFGYECKFPNVYINNLTIDNQYNKKSEYILIFPNYNSKNSMVTEVTKDYWPDEIIINGYKFINNNYENPYIKISIDDIESLKDTKIYINDIIKGDLDEDGIITVNDLAMLKLHYIGLRPLKNNIIEVADIDEDNKVTINDIALLKLILIKITK